jgi:hypothetical protein
VVSVLLRTLLPAIHFLTAAVGLVAGYTLLTAGSEDSLLRAVFPDPSADVYIAAISSFIVFVLGFFIFYGRDRETFRNLVAWNEKRIAELRKKGVSDAAIADEILEAMGATSGRRYTRAKKKLEIALAEFPTDSPPNDSPKTGNSGKAS